MTNIDYGRLMARANYDQTYGRPENLARIEFPYMGVGEAKLIDGMIELAPDLLAAVEAAEQQLDYGQVDAARKILTEALAKVRRMEGNI